MPCRETWMSPFYCTFYHDNIDELYRTSQEHLYLKLIPLQICKAAIVLVNALLAKSPLSFSLHCFGTGLTVTVKLAQVGSINGVIMVCLYGKSSFKNTIRGDDSNIFNVMDI